MLVITRKRGSVRSLLLLSDDDDDMMVEFSVVSCDEVGACYYHLRLSRLLWLSSVFRFQPSLIVACACGIFALRSNRPLMDLAMKDSSRQRAAGSHQLSRFGYVGK
eukprot:scaffold6636_cov80-Skeletonema_marinoi.AAC.1